MAANADQKLLGVLTLDLGMLRKQVGEANNMLKTLGRGIDLDLSKAAGAQIKKSMQEIAKLAEENGRKQQDAAKKSTEAIREQARHYAAELTEVQKITKQLGADLEVVGMRVEGIGKNGSKLSLQTDAAGGVRGGTESTLNQLAVQKQSMADINALYRDQLAQIRMIYDLKGKQVTS